MSLELAAPVPPTVLSPDPELFEIVDGEKKEIPHMGALAGAIASFLVTHLNVYGWSRKLGFAVAEVLFNMHPDLPQRRPDLVFIPYSRWQTPARSAPDPAVWVVVPSLAVEVVSPTNTADEVLDKLVEYFTAGVGVVWVIYPRQRVVYAYNSATDVRILAEHDELDGGIAVPGFRLRVAELFAALSLPE
jgi:Uma2 family endonuclease